MLYHSCSPFILPFNHLQRVFSFFSHCHVQHYEPKHIWFVSNLKLHRIMFHPSTPFSATYPFNYIPTFLTTYLFVYLPTFLITYPLIYLHTTCVTPTFADSYNTKYLGYWFENRNNDFNQLKPLMTIKWQSPQIQVLQLYAIFIVLISHLFIHFDLFNA